MSKPIVELVPSAVIEPNVERIEAPDDRPAVGSWWWVRASKKTDDEDCDRGRQWLGCVIEVGSNYAVLQGIRLNRRIALDDMPECCLAESDPFAFIDGKINEHKTEVRQLMGKIQKVCAQLGVPMHEALTESNAASQALATTSGVADVKAYENALVKAKNKTLPELFKLVKEQHELMATWMQAELIPAKAELARAKDVTERIESKIHMVELYAGLQEELVQVREGEPADADERVHIRQRRCYMDEECLARYEAGGMDFDNVEDFDKWLARTENMVRILPDKRAIVAFRIRRKDKRYGGERDTIANFIQFWHWNNANKQTLLYIRNGDQLWRIRTSMSFDHEIFPRAEDHDLLGADEIWVSTNSHPVEFISGRRRLGMIESYREERSDTARELLEWKRQGKPEKEWVMPGDKTWTWSSNGTSIQGRRFGRPDCRAYPHFKHYELITPLHIYHDDAMRAAKKAAEAANQLAVIIQGLLDRSTCLHPHPPWKLWTPEGFERALKLVYDASLTISPGEAPDFEGYRAQLNKSLRVGAVVIGQDVAFSEEMEDKYGEKWDRYDSRCGNGPKAIAVIEAIRGGKALFTHYRSRRRAKWVPHPTKSGFLKATYDDIEMKWWCPLDKLTCIDAYTPNDYRIFFDDPRTRENYLEWAPILLTAENFHNARRTIPEVLKERLVEFVDARGNLDKHAIAQELATGEDDE